MSIKVGLGTIAALLSVIVAIELAQLTILGGTWVRSRTNQRRIDALLQALGVDPEDPPAYDVDDVATDGGRRE